MTYEFSISAFFIGFLIVVAGVIFVRWHQKIADNLGSGVASYDRYKLWGLIACGVGLFVMLNLHVFIIGGFLKSFIPGL